MSATPDGESDSQSDSELADQSDDDKRETERRRLIDLTRPEKGLPERRKLGTDRRTTADDLDDPDESAR